MPNIRLFWEALCNTFLMILQPSPLSNIQEGRPSNGGGGKRLSSQDPQQLNFVGQDNRVNGICNKLSRIAFSRSLTCRRMTDTYGNRLTLTYLFTATASNLVTCLVLFTYVLVSDKVKSSFEKLPLASSGFIRTIWGKVDQDKFQTRLIRCTSTKHVVRWKPMDGSHPALSSAGV